MPKDMLSMPFQAVYDSNIRSSNKRRFQRKEPKTESLHIMHTLIVAVIFKCYDSMNIHLIFTLIVDDTMKLLNITDYQHDFRAH
ncbi:unnamed protein product [Rotaria magnacalcarata]|uniref:Uncharacterized protein n=1 Tax=Rotaria magnacalcarata TaxID=392030 RepID=A0A819U9H0_9BILA|nr:unnamed protein product [Rotaria magnacalcarata]CAF3992312.1 unnamed protein product [Rotaria magnacalcarata]CAF4054363.1 unnamed protein product [Rotaria magnacalcarata]CAF4091832.1 unnamed protein product [Rotaria magnacalcarata]CAF4533977.1 unnamed protein product [Rotaria magnacalcarata]